MRRFGGLVAACLMLAAGAREARAWGIEGHIVIADIAEAHLRPRALSAAQGLLGSEHFSHLDEIANWADDIVAQHPETGAWHYVNIPLDATTYDAARDCPTGACVVAKIAEFEIVLANRSAPVATRLEALKYVVHFIADVHQPFHVANDHDRGGNDVLVGNYSRGANLHRIWDIDLIAADDPDAAHLAHRLNAQIAPGVLTMLGESTPVDWANETHMFAREAYGLVGTPAPHAVIDVPASYAILERPILERQLAHAGIRLAATLNRLLAEG